MITHTPECAARAVAERDAVNAWCARWPGYCSACYGHGQHVEPQTWDSPGWIDPCDDCTGQGICARCGEPGLTSEERGDESTGTGPCSACGWNYDDPMPEVTCDPCECWHAAYRAEVQ